MTDLEERKEAARQKIEKEMGETDTPLGQIGMILLAWLDYPDGAAEKINQESKTLDGAYEALRNHASKHKGKSMSYCINPAEAMEIILEYFGQPDPKGVIEGGLMYKAMTEAAAKFKPYGADSAEELPKPQPVAEKPQQKKSISALDALSLEDFGL